MNEGGRCCDILAVAIIRKCSGCPFDEFSYASTNGLLPFNSIVKGGKNDDSPSSDGGDRIKKEGFVAFKNGSRKNATGISEDPEKIIYFPSIAQLPRCSGHFCAAPGKDTILEIHASILP